MAIESVLLVCGLVMTFKAYVRREARGGNTSDTP
jgi:exosortase/archaeosortase